MDPAAGPGQSRDEMIERLRWTADLTRRSDPRSAIVRDPLRLTSAVGAILLIVGSALPWATGLVGRLAVSHSALDGAADGAILMVLGIVQLVLTRDRSMATATTTAVRYAPLGLGLVCLGIWGLGVQAALIDIGHWIDDDGSGALAIGAWIAGLGGAVLVAVAGTATSLLPRPNAETVRLGRPGREAIEPVAAAIGAVAGIVVGMLGVINIVPNPAFAGFGLMVAAAVGGLVGGFGGSYLGRLLARVRQGDAR